MPAVNFAHADADTAIVQPTRSVVSQHVELGDGLRHRSGVSGGTAFRGRFRFRSAR
jgi:hypothetical protein